MTKRPRSPERPVERPTTATTLPMSASSPPEASQIEEIVIEEETCDLLVRFPCFDFFRTVHLCERKGTSSASFAPDTVHFVPDSLATDHPILVINPCTEKEMIFGCSWAEVCSASGVPGTNRAIVHLAAESNAEPQRNCTLPTLSARPEGTVASLLTHVVGGVSADAERVQRLGDAARAAQQSYDLITAPSAILVAERLR